MTLYIVLSFAKSGAGLECIAQCPLGRRVLALSFSLNNREIGWTRKIFFSIIVLLVGWASKMKKAGWINRRDRARLVSSSMPRLGLRQYHWLVELHWSLDLNYGLPPRPAIGICSLGSQHFIPTKFVPLYSFVQLDMFRFLAFQDGTVFQYRSSKSREMSC